MGKGPSKVLAIDLLNASSANWSHQSGDSIDTSMDWRNRLFRINAMICGVGSITANPFVWDPAAPGSYIPSSDVLGGQILDEADAVGATMYPRDLGSKFRMLSTHLSESVQAQLVASPVSFFGGVVWRIPNNTNGGGLLPASSGIWLVADDVSGNLRLYVQGTPGVALLIWLDSTSQISNLPTFQT